MIEPELKKRVIDKVIECKQLAFERLGLQLAPIQIKFDLKGWRAGEAIKTNILGAMSNLTIRLNEEYLKRYTETMISQTIPHEVAHLVADVYYGMPCKHGMGWRNVMVKVYNLSPDRTHNYKAPTTGHTKYEYYCEPCNRTLSIGVRHYNRVIKGEDIRCRTCKTRLAVNPEFYVRIN